MWLLFGAARPRRTRNCSGVVYQHDQQARYWQPLGSAASPPLQPHTTGVACDPDTGKPIPCTPGCVSGAQHYSVGCTALLSRAQHYSVECTFNSLHVCRYKRAPSATFRGTSAKQLSVKLLETREQTPVCSHLEHANYLGACVITNLGTQCSQITDTHRSRVAKGRVCAAVGVGLRARLA